MIDTTTELDGASTVSKFLELPQAIESYVKNGDLIAMEGLTHLIPFAAGHEIIRQKITDLTAVRLTPDLIYDQMHIKPLLIGLVNYVSIFILSILVKKNSSFFQICNMKPKTKYAHFNYLWSAH